MTRRWVAECMMGALLAFFLLCTLGTTAYARTSAMWTYIGEITNKGTRSEGFCGYLLYEETLLPGQLAKVLTPIGTYVYKPGNPVPWAVQGWIKVADATPPTLTGAPLNKATHWYRGSRRRGTTDSWIFLPKFNYWVDSSFLSEFTRTVLKGVPNPDTTSLNAMLGLHEKPPSVSAKPGAGMTVFAYTYGIAAAGSRSAGARGELFLNGKPMPPPSGARLVTPIGVYFYAEPNERLWLPSGWFPAEDIKVEETGHPFEPADWNKGAYRGPKRAGTPTDWCYSPETNMWYSPERLLRGY